MTFALASHVVVQSVDPERGDEEAKLPTALLAETAPCAAPSSNRHQSQVAVRARHCQPAPASLHLSHRTLRSTCCCRLLRDRRAPSPPSRARWKTSFRLSSSSFSTIYRRSDAPRARMRAAACRCETAWSFLTAAQVAGLVQQGGSCHRAARARRLRVVAALAALLWSLFAASMLDAACEKNGRVPVHFSRVVRTSVCVSCVFLTL